MSDVNFTEIDREGLRTLADSDPVAKKAFLLLAQRQRKRTELTADVLMRDLETSRSQTIQFFKELENLNCGRLIVGRGSKPTRFRWQYTMGTVAQVALRQLDNAQPMPGPSSVWPPMEDDSADATAENLPNAPTVTAPVQTQESSGTPAPRIVNYPYPLRPGMLISVSLPADMTAQEADRFAAFVRSLAITPPS